MVFNNSINLRGEFENLLKEFGIKVLYIRRSHLIKCECYDELYKTGDVNCKHCLGTGRVISAKLVNTIRRNSQAEYDQLKVGYQISKDTIFYFSNRFEPKNGDYILIVKYNSNGIVKDIHEVYEILYSNETRGDNGRIEFYNAKVVFRDDKKHLFDKLIKTIDLHKRRLLKGGRCIDVRAI